MHFVSLSHGVLKDMDQDPGVYANVTHSTSQEGVFKRGNSNKYVCELWIHSAASLNRRGLRELGVPE